MGRRRADEVQEVRIGLTDPAARILTDFSDAARFKAYGTTALWGVGLGALVAGVGAAYYFAPKAFQAATDFTYRWNPFALLASGKFSEVREKMNEIRGRMEIYCDPTLETYDEAECIRAKQDRETFLNELEEEGGLFGAAAEREQDPRPWPVKLLDPHGWFISEEKYQEIQDQEVEGGSVPVAPGTTRAELAESCKSWAGEEPPFGTPQWYAWYLRYSVCMKKAGG